MYKITNWEYSKYTENDVKQPPKEWLGVGEYDLRIKDCFLDAVTSQYTLYVEDVQTEKQGKFSYYLTTKDGNVNNYQVGTLISLGKALFGKEVGVPHFEDVIGGVVHAKIEAGKQYIRPDGTVVNYTAIYKYEPVSKEILDLVRQSGLTTIEQYTEG